MEITRPNQVWVMDVTPASAGGRLYFPMARGFVYLALVLDWLSRRVLSWRLSITMEAAFCVATLEDALARHGKPDIFNTDQGSQFTGQAFTQNRRRSPCCSGSDAAERPHQFANAASSSSARLMQCRVDNRRYGSRQRRNGGRRPIRAGVASREGGPRRSIAASVLAAKSLSSPQDLVVANKNRWG
jgi:hypothetical protein